MSQSIEKRTKIRILRFLKHFLFLKSMRLLHIFLYLFDIEILYRENIEIFVNNALKYVLVLFFCK